MIRVLTIEDQEPEFLALQRQLAPLRNPTIQMQWLAEFSEESIKQSNCDLIVVTESELAESCLEQLTQLLDLKLEQPILFIARSFSSKICARAMQFGADDCLAKNQMTPDQFQRVAEHALIRHDNRTDSVRLTTHDQLTGLANRYLLYEHLEHAITIAKRNSSQFAILFIDLDRFKLINDSLGHDVGDILLIQVAERLSTCVRETDIVARFGNDEFAILLENAGSSRNIAVIAGKIQSAMEPAFEVRAHELFITASIGIATFPECGINPDTLLKSADSALYKAKEIGRNKFHFYTDDLNKQARLKLELEKNLRRALINSEFSIHLQPQLSTLNEQVAGAEALLRWKHPKYGYISPAVFIPLLDDLGLLTGVEGWVLNQVCLLAKRLTDQYGRLRFSVNVSGTHFKVGKLKENIFLALQSSSLDASYLEIELTEDIMIDHVERNSDLLNDLKELGVSVALDDFGKGYSSLSYLKNFPANVLKIDKAFIDHLVNDTRDAAIVEAMIKLSHKLGIKVVAEGVEDKGQLAELSKFGCDYIQGFYFARPMPVDEFEKYIANRAQHCAKSVTKHNHPGEHPI